MRFLLSFLLIVCLPLPASSAKVVKIVDGDTIILDDSSRVRLYGIDCPERGQAEEIESTQAARELALGKTVEIETMYQDRYGRVVAIVILESGVTLQSALLQKGLAWVAPRYCKRLECVEWKVLEDAARHEQRGLWSNQSPLPPWEWRRRGKSGE